MKLIVAELAIFVCGALVGAGLMLKYQTATGPAVVTQDVAGIKAPAASRSPSTLWECECSPPKDGYHGTIKSGVSSSGKPVVIVGGAK